MAANSTEIIDERYYEILGKLSNVFDGDLEDIERNVRNELLAFNASKGVDSLSEEQIVKLWNSCESVHHGLIISTTVEEMFGSHDAILKSDEHYRGIEDGGGVEPIIIMEQLIESLIGAGIEPKSAACIFLAQKHITRAGVKEGEDWKKEIQKSINYLTRAVTGKWAV